MLNSQNNNAQKARQELYEQRAANNEIKNDLTQLRKSHEDLTATCQSFQSANDRLIREEKEQDELTTVLKQKLLKTQGENHSLQSEKKELEQEVLDLRARNAQMTNELVPMNKELVHQCTELKKKLDTSKEAHRKGLIDLEHLKSEH